MHESNKDASAAASTVIITRPPHQAQNLLNSLHQLGRKTAIFPLFEIVPIADNGEVDQAVLTINQYAMVMFVSPNAVDAMFKRIQVLMGTDWRWPRETAIAVVGVASRHALLKYGVSDETAHILSPRNLERTDSETLLETLDLANLVEQKVLIVRADSGRAFFADALRHAQIKVQIVTAYQRVVPTFDLDKRDALKAYLEGACDWVITSSSVLSTLLEWCSQLDQDAQKNGSGNDHMQESAVSKMQQQKLFVPHFRIAEVARELGFKHICLSASGDEKLILALQSSL